VAGAVLIAAASAVVLAAAARRRGWGVAHVAAAGAGALVSRGVLAFTYFPLVGETAPLGKYTHNVVMLGIVGAMGAYAVARARDGLAGAG
jgi:hypothetical protein